MILSTIVKKFTIINFTCPVAGFFYLYAKIFLYVYPLPLPMGNAVKYESKSVEHKDYLLTK